MTENEIPQFIKEIKTDIGFNIVDLYRKVLSNNATLNPSDYRNVLQVLQMKFDQDYRSGKLDLVQANLVAFSILDLSYKLDDYESQIITLSNLGLMYQNAHAYDIALEFASQGIKIAYKHNLLEAKLKALNVVSLVYTNTMESEKQTEVMEEVAEIYGKLGQMDKKAELEALIKQKREFMKLLGK